MANSSIPGEYTINFRGFERDARAVSRSRYLVGVGWLRLVETSPGLGTVTGVHRSINMPMSGGGNASYHAATYDLTGSWKAITIATGGTFNPLCAEVTIEFTEQTGGNGGHMSDKFVAMQCGPDRFWLVSNKPEDLAGGRKAVDEVAFGDAAKVTAAW